MRAQLARCVCLCVCVYAQIDMWVPNGLNTLAGAVVLGMVMMLMLTVGRGHHDTTTASATAHQKSLALPTKPLSELTATFFYHVPTSGGRSLASVMDKMGPSVRLVNMGLYTNAEDTPRMTPSLISACNDTTVQDVFVYGHYLARDNLETLCRPRRIRYVVVLREPVQRVTSWVLHQATDELRDQFMRNVTNWLNTANIENCVTYQLGGNTDEFRQRSNATSVYAAAMRRLNQCHVLFMSDMRDWLDDLGKCVSLNLVPHIRTERKAGVKQNRTLTSEQHRRIVQLNQLDLKLYAEMQRKHKASFPMHELYCS
eukprot:m.54415 g.54415  ORF g.54415 m.54415 type:complete len:313 (+) comp7524_c0_seq1:371-1309(+)